MTTNPAPVDVLTTPALNTADAKPVTTELRGGRPRWTSQTFFLCLAVSILFINFLPLGFERLNLRPIDVTGALCWMIFLAVPTSRPPPDPRLWRPAVIIVGTVLLAYLVNGVVWYDDELLIELGQRCLRLFLILGPLAAASKVRLTSRQADRLLILMAASALIGVYASVVAYWAGSPLVAAHQTLAEGNRRVPRLGGLVGETGAFSLYFYVAAVLVIFVGLRRRQLPVALAMALPMWALALDGTAARISIVMIVPLCALTGLHAMRGKWSRALLPCLAVGLLIVAVTAADAVTQSPAIDRLLSALQDGGSVTSGRSQHWSELFGRFMENPVFGRGYRSSEFTVGPSENVVVQGLVEFGLVGSVILALAVRRIVTASVQVVKLRSEAEAVVLTGLLWGVLVQWLVNDVSTYYQAFSLVVLLLVIAPRLSVAGPERRKKRRKRAKAKSRRLPDHVIDLREIQPPMAPQQT